MNYRYSRTYQGSLQAAIFDWAGTTVDFGCCAPAVVFLEVFKRKGVEITIEQAREPMGRHKRDHIAAIAAMEPVAKTWESVHGARPEDADVSAMYEEFIPLQIETLSNYSDVIPGAVEAMKQLREKGLKIGSTTGYITEMMDVVTAEAKKQGYEPDAMLCVSDVPAGRPAPWMAFKNCERLNVYPMQAVVKVGDTVPDVLEGLNAGMWTIGVTDTGNEMGLTLEEYQAIDEGTKAARRVKAAEKLARAGAHYVVDGIEAVPALVDAINQRLAAGERP
jgi:phosphonoacetaldehyde hydrolase